jgi:hypothetical protein
MIELTGKNGAITHYITCMESDLDKFKALGWRFAEWDRKPFADHIGQRLALVYWDGDGGPVMPSRDD